MPDTVDFFFRSVFLGGILTTSIYCFVTWLSRGRDKLFLGYGMFTLASTGLFFFRRVFPFLISAGPEGAAAAEILTAIFVNLMVGSGLYYFLVFLRVPRGGAFYRFFIIAYAVLSAFMLGVIPLSLQPGQSWWLSLFYVAVGAFTFLGVLYLIRVIKRRETPFQRDKRILFYLGAVLLFLVVLSIIKVFITLFPFHIMLLAIYCFLLFFFFIHGSKLNADYRELVELKTDLERKVTTRTEEVEELHRKKQRFFIMFTHETKTPLTLVSSYLERYMAQSPAHPDLDIIKRNLGKLRNDMTNYLEYEKLMTDYEHFDHDQTTDIGWLLREKVILFRPLAAAKHIDLRETLTEGMTLAADPAALDHVINNLLDNAVKYTPDGGRIEAVLSRKPKKILLTVRDTGVGITTEQQEHIFDPFYQVSRKQGPIQGIGMGLSIVRQIMEGLNGTITIKSRPAPRQPKKGERAWVTEITAAFPRRKPPGAAARRVEGAFAVSRPAGPFTPVPAPGLPHDREKPTLFFVEDNAELLYFLLTGLEDRFNVYGAANGAAALERIDSLPKPDVIISDIMMDVMDGYEFFNRLKTRPRYDDVPFIFLTAVSSPLEKIKSLSGGAVDFITKPLSGLAELEAKISSLLEFVSRKTALLKKDLLERLRQVMAQEQRNLSGQDDLLERNMHSFGLTERESRIVECLREGLQNKEISARLGTSTRTVDTHLYNIYRKTGAQNRIDLLNRLLTQH